jgi:hypothetical protein
VLQKRGGQDDESVERSGEMAALETMRSAAGSGGEKPQEKKGEEHISLFWRVFGGTILSIVALVSITLYNNISSSITELRTELGREREARAGLVKKEEFNTRVTAQYERMRGIDTVKVELEGLKEKTHASATAVDAVKRDTAATADAMKKDAAALEVLRERVAAVEGVKKDVAGLDTLKEKVTAAAADLKAMREEVQKLSGEVERNKVSDLERKTLRDSQYKQVEETLKELQKGLQDCREKLARLEGSQPKPPVDGAARPIIPSTAKPWFDFTAPPKPVAPSEVKPAGGTVEPGTGKPDGR